MADGKDYEEGFRTAHRRVGRGASAIHPSRPNQAHRPHAALTKRCTSSGIHLVEGGAIVRFTPWSCATCGTREDLVISGGIAFCSDCLDASSDSSDDVYRDTGGGD